MLFSASPLIGLDIGSSTVKAVALASRDGKVIVERAGLAPMPGGAFSHGALLDPPAVVASIRKLCRQARLRSRRVAVAMSGPSVFLSRLTLLRSAGSSLDSLESEVRREMAPLTPFPLAEAVVDFHSLGDAVGSPCLEVLAVAARLDEVQLWRRTLARAGRSAAVVDAAPCALANAFEFCCQPPPEELAVLLHVGAATMTACIVRGAAPLAARDVAFSLPAMGGPDRIAVELERMLEQLDDAADERPLQPRSSQLARLWLSGGGSRLPGLLATLSSRFRLPIEEMNPFSRIEFGAADKLSRLIRDHAHCMTLAVGLALRGLDPP